MNVTSPANPFEALWRMGYRRLCPITPPGCPVHPESTIARKMAKGIDSRGKAPGVLRGDSWIGYPFLSRAARESDLDDWRRMGGGVGILTGEGIAAIDADCRRIEDAAAAREEIERLGALPERIGRAPKALFVCRTDSDFRYARLDFGEGERVEILAEGRQFVAHGVHPGTLRPYSWTRRLVPLDELPFVPSSALSGLLETLRTRLPDARPVERRGDGAVPDQDTLKGTLALVRAAVGATPNSSSRFPTREDYLDYGYAIKAALPDHPEEAFALFSAWCEDWKEGENDPETVESDWRRMRPPYRRGASWLYELAEKSSAGLFSRASAWAEEIPPEAPVAEPLFPAEPIAERRRPTHYAWPEACLIPPRRTLYGGHYVRQWVSSTIAPSKVGKSSLVLVEALAMASGKPLLGIQPSGTFRVWWWNGEDPKDELERRIAAAIQFYGLVHEDLMDRLMVDSGRDMPLTLAIEERSGGRVVEETSRALIQDISEFQIDCAMFDPFVSFHKVSENDNNMIDLVAKECNRIAGATNSAVELAHHTRKLYGGGATVEDGRGASALLATTRSTRALARMTQDEAKQFGVTIDPRLLFRFADAASNVFAPDPEMDERWFKFESVNLGNGDGEEAMDKIMNGDSVGVVTRFDVGAARSSALETAGLASGAPEALAREEAALTAIRAQECRLDIRSDAWVGVPVAQALGIDRDTPEGVNQIKSIIKEWIKQGKLREENHLDKARRVKTYITAPVLSDAISLFE